MSTPSQRASRSSADEKVAPTSDDADPSAMQMSMPQRRGTPVMSKKAALSAYMAIAASAFGLISDGYHNNLMTMTNVVFKKLHPTEYTASVSTRVSNALLIGEVLGQVFVGIVCDRAGRKAGLVVTTVLIVIGAILCTAAQGAHGSVQGLFWFMTIARGITGVGTGGEYPASSTSASEGADEKMGKNRGPVFIMVTGLPLSIGGPLVVSIFLIVLSAAGENHLNTVWRVCFGLGILLPLTVFYFRMRMISSKLYREAAIKTRVPYWLALKRYWRPLIGTCGTWFLFDFISYPNGIFSAVIISSVIKDGSVKSTAEWQLLLTSLGIPGIILGAVLCNPLGRRNTMMLGFGGYIVFGLIVGCGYDKITRIIPLFVVFYGLMSSLGAMGPGNMTLVASAESYPTPIRGTFFGLSAALGKTGAAIVYFSAFLLVTVLSASYSWTFIIAAIFGCIGIIITYFFVPDMTGVDLVDEDEKFLQYLAENGWHGDVGEEGSEDGMPMEDDSKSATDVKDEC